MHLRDLSDMARRTTGDAYTAQFINTSQFDAIVATARETCR